MIVLGNAPGITKIAVKRLLQTVPLGVWQRLFPREVVCPFYHVVSDEPLPHLQHYPYKNRAQFSADVAFARERFGFMPYDELVARRLRGQSGPANRVLFTFDDGLRECWTVICPILQQHGASGVFFVTTDYLDNRRPFFETAASLCIDAVGRIDAGEAAELVARWQITPSDPRIERQRSVLTRGRISPPASEAQRLLILHLLGLGMNEQREIDDACAALRVDVPGYLREHPVFMTVEEVRQLAAAGFTIGGHSMSHCPLYTLEPAKIEREMVGSCDAVRQITGQAKVPFAFPYSGHGISKPFLADVHRRHPEIELFFDIGGFCKNEPFMVDRFWVDQPSPKPGRPDLHDQLLARWAHPSAW